MQEGLIITGELVEAIETKKFIPLLRANSSPQKIPTFMGPRKYIDFSEDARYNASLDALLRELHGHPPSSKPPLGPSPFSGSARRATPARTAGPSGLTPAGTPVLTDVWFAKHAETASAGLAALNKSAAMELRFALHDPVAKSQLELLNSMRNSEIHTFGWPIGITMESVEKFRPRPTADGIVAEISMGEGESVFGRLSYDYWAARTNGDFYLFSEFVRR